jgi:hypothetical protein
MILALWLHTHEVLAFKVLYFSATTLIKVLIIGLENMVHAHHRRPLHAAEGSRLVEFEFIFGRRIACCLNLSRIEQSTVYLGKPNGCAIQV